MGKHNLAPLECSKSLNGTIGTVTNKNEHTGGNKSSADPRRDAISKHLQDAYRSVVEEPLPDSFEDLLSQLDDRIAAGDDEPSDAPKAD